MTQREEAGAAAGPGPNRFVGHEVVRFSHCDPAGIIFYPRYFEIVHAVLEDWFADGLGLPFRRVITELRVGFPIVKLESDFTAGSRLGDHLDIALTVAKLGNASVGVDYVIHCAGELRMRMRSVIVHTDLASGRAMPIGDEIRGRLESFVRDGPVGTAGRGGRRGR